MIETTRRGRSSRRVTSTGWRWEIHLCRGWRFTVWWLSNDRKLFQANLPRRRDLRLLKSFVIVTKDIDVSTWVLGSWVGVTVGGSYRRPEWNWRNIQRIEIMLSQTRLTPTLSYRPFFWVNKSLEPPTLLLPTPVVLVNMTRSVWRSDLTLLLPLLVWRSRIMSRSESLQWVICVPVTLRNRV